MRLLSIIIGLTVFYGSVTTFDEEELDKAIEWLNEVYDWSAINDRFGSQPDSKGRLCVFSSKQNGTCVKKELCLNAAPTVDPTTLFMLRERDDSCSATETCCLHNTEAPPKPVVTENPTRSQKDDSCTTDRREEGVCVKKSLCSNAVQTVDPASRFILRERGTTCHYLEACCLKSNIQTVTIKAASSNVQNGCGWSNPGANIFREKSSASGLADYGEFPWMIALIKKANEKNGFNQSYAGGGALIHPSVVITAAHKIMDYKPAEIKVRAGEWDTRTEAEVDPYQEIDVTKFIIHEEFNRVHVHNNVALLILKSPVDLTDAPHIGVACIAPQLPPPGTRCFSMGWGKNFLNDDVYSVILKKLELPLVQGAICEKQYQGTILTSAYKLDKSLTCAGGEKGVDTCDGDGGSPLVCPVAGQSERYALVGMVAYGLGCGIEHLPGVYVNVPHVYDWVGRQLTSEGLNKSSFVY